MFSIERFCARRERGRFARNGNARGHRRRRIRDVREAVNLLVKEKKRFFPNKDKAAKYEEKFEKYRKLYALMKQI